MGVSEIRESESRCPGLPFDEEADRRLADALTQRGYDVQTYSSRWFIGGF